MDIRECMDGMPYLLTMGEDFDHWCNVRAESVAAIAAEQGLRVRWEVLPDGNVVIQALLPNDPRK